MLRGVSSSDARGGASNGAGDAAARRGRALAQHTSVNGCAPQRERVRAS